MGQKVSPIGLRLGINKTWSSKWFEDKKTYADSLHEDLSIRRYITNYYYKTLKEEQKKIGGKRESFDPVRPSWIVSIMEMTTSRSLSSIW